MRILCLHGAGSSGSIFEAQIANLQHQLDPSIELVFTDGPFECERGPGAYLTPNLPCVTNISVYRRFRIPPRSIFHFYPESCTIFYGTSG